jgi:excinuclease ABC subunit A
MLKSSARSAIRLRGVRHNNLKNFDLDLPLNQLIVITGLSGSGKSSLAFDTLFAEGQRRYIETFSPYARQFFDRMDKPQVDSIEGIPPAIAIEQRNSVRTTRSTVGTMTELCDYMKMLWPHVARLHCRECGQPVVRESPQEVWQAVNEYSVFSIQCSELIVTFDLPLAEKLSLSDSLALIAKQGYQRLLIGGEIVRLDEVSSRSMLDSSRSTRLTVVQDRLKPSPANRARFIEACEQAYHFGKGKLAIHGIAPASGKSQPMPDTRLFSNRLHCAKCDIEYREPSPALFSFNHPVGACPACKGFGRIISIDYDLAIPDRSRTLAEGVVRPWHTGHGLDSQKDLLKMCRHFEIPTDVPFQKLPKKWQELVIEGEPDYGKDEEHEWPRAWYGVKGYFRWLESKAYKMHVRVMLSRYRAYTTCPDCKGQRFQPDALLYRVAAKDTLKGGHRTDTAVRCPPFRVSGITLADFYQLPIRDALQFTEALGSEHQASAADPLGLALNEVRSRLGYLVEVGLGYLTLDRSTRSLSGGETERVSLTTCLGTRLVNTLFVLDEPSVGLHSRDTDRLISILGRLRDAGNTVVVVEHEASVMRAADQIVDIGPGHGATGGQVVFQGRYADIVRCKNSLTGQYLGRRLQIEIPKRREVQTNAPFESSRYPRKSADDSNGFVLNEAPVRYGIESHSSEVSHSLKLSHAARNNLKDISVTVPLGRFVCITGVSGSGKTTLVREVLLPLLTSRLGADDAGLKASDRLDTEEKGDDSEEAPGSRPSSVATLEGYEHLSRVVLVDQSILGKTPRSNPAVYIGAFDDVREVFAQSEVARQRGLNASSFSFNSAQGQCERCRGAGFEKIEMQFLSDVFIRCPDCNGRRYRQHILEVTIRSQESGVRSQKQEVRGQRSGGGKSIADVLDSTVEEAIEFLAAFEESRPAQRAVRSLKLLAEVGLGYLKLGQPINTLSGGESQRLKLVRHLAESSVATDPARRERLQPKGRGNLANEHAWNEGQSLSRTAGSAATLFFFDEPTTGLHFDDVRALLKVFQRLVDSGNSVVVIEHNLDVIKSADWVIDLGPDAGDQGGEVVAEGTPEDIAESPDSHTGKALRGVLGATKTPEGRRMKKHHV